MSIEPLGDDFAQILNLEPNALLEIVKSQHVALSALRREVQELKRQIADRQAAEERLSLY